MKYTIGFLFVFFWGCSKDTATGSRVFAAEHLTIVGNPFILGEPASTAEDPSDFIRVRGGVDSQSGLELTGLKVLVRVLGANAVQLGISEDACKPAEIAPGGSCTFEMGVALNDNTSFRASRTIEITPSCDQGTGRSRAISVDWPDQ